MVADPALRFGRSFCRHQQDAEEVMQDVLVSLARGLSSFRGDAALSTWAYQVARHACIRRRRRVTERRLEPLDRHNDRVVSRRDETEAGSDPQRRHERLQLTETIERAIASLPPAQREVVILRDVEGLPAREVARITGLGERAVKSRLHRGRLALRQALAPALGRSAEGGQRSKAVGARRRGCPDTGRLVSRYLEGELGATECAALARHVAGCPDCSEACAALRAALGSCRDIGEQPLSSELRARLRQAIRDVARAEASEG